MCEVQLNTCCSSGDDSKMLMVKEQHDEKSEDVMLNDHTCSRI